MATEVIELLRKRGVDRFGLRIHQAGEYPQKLRDARDPVELLYFQGTWELVETRCVAIVGSRKPSDDGRKRARRLARALVQDGFTIVSGLATGIDTEAHTTAIEAGGQTIAVVGTPLGEYYPPENRALQDRAIVSERELRLTSRGWSSPRRERAKCVEQRHMTQLRCPLLVIYRRRASKTNHGHTAFGFGVTDARAIAPARRRERGNRCRACASRAR